MTKDIEVRIRGTQHADASDTDEPVEMKTKGIHRVVGGRHHIRYDEIIGGTSGNTRNHVAVSPDRVEVHKTGLVQTDLIFEKGRTHPVEYGTRFGTVRMEITTSGLNVLERENRLDVRLEYELSADHHHISDCVMEMTFLSAE